MSRRTVYLPDSVEELARESTEAGESFSATVARLIEAGARSTQGRKRPRYVGAGDGPGDLGRMAEVRDELRRERVRLIALVSRRKQRPGDLGRMAERYLREPVDAR
jgi:hypothetical protein